MIKVMSIYMILIIMINYITDSQEQELSSVNPQYENVHLPVPQSELSMKECAAYGVVEGTRL